MNITIQDIILKVIINKKWRAVTPHKRRAVINKILNSFKRSVSCSKYLHSAITIQFHIF